MKTIYEWIYTLPPEQKEKALHNMSHHPFMSPTKYVSSLKMALLHAFIWGAGQEGVKYWSDIYHDRNKELF